MKRINYSLWTLFMAGAVLLIACKKDQAKEEKGSAEERTAVLKNIGNNIILPRYETLEQASKTLKTACDTFVNNPTSTHLSNLQQQWETTYMAWQHCSVFEVGPAKNNILREAVNTFPTDSSNIETRIDSANYSIGDNFAYKTVKGFPALDLLLFSYGSNSEILTQYTTASDAGNRKQYLQEVCKDLNNNIQNVTNKWPESGGNYIETFINSNGTEAGSAFSVLVNEFNFDYELIKNAEIGIPLGKKNLGDPLPRKVQALYSGISLKLSKEHIQALENVYLGTGANGNDGKGFDDYLKFLDSKALAKDIRNQFDKAQNKLNQVPAPLQDAVVNNTATVDDAYQAIQKQVVFIKTDMPSVMGVTITYQDNDGD